MQEQLNKKMPLDKILIEGLNYCNKNLQKLIGFMGINYIICGAMAYYWKTFYLWPLLLILYVLWSVGFRYYFERKPYFDGEALFSSLVPSTKIVVLSVMVVSLFLLLPIAVLFVPILPDDFMKAYALFLQKNMQETDAVDMVINLILVIFSPQILYRPMLAWIASLLGRSGSLSLAWEKTQGNYWNFLLLAIIINLSLTMVYNVILWIGGSIYVALIPISVLVIYFNVVLARIYTFFFLE